MWENDAVKFRPHLKQSPESWLRRRRRQNGRTGRLGVDQGVEVSAQKGKRQTERREGGLAH